MKAKFVFVLGLLVLFALLVITSGATPAHASSNTWLVNAAYADDSNCTALVRRCKTFGQAVTNASTGDSLVVMPGTYSVTQVVIDKPLAISGSGATQTILDGGSVTTLPRAGMIKITASTGSVTFSGFTIRNAGTCGTCGDDPNHPGLKTRIALLVGSSTSGAYTISNNKIQGSNNPSDAADFGFYAQNGKETLVFKNNQVTQTGANPITLENHSGASDVSFNTFDRGIGSGAEDAYFNMNDGGANITTLQKVSYNTIDLGTGAGPYTNDNHSTGITFAGNFAVAAAPGGYTNVQIVGNTITNIQDYRRGIGLWNVSTDANGNIANAVITGNTITGLGRPGSKGIQLIDYVTGTIIQSNNISNVDYAFHGRSYAGSTAPTGLTVSYNSFTNATTGFKWDWTPTLNAPSNWWGCATGPTTSGCIPVVGNVNYAPFARALTTSTTASTHEIGETGTLQTNVTVNGLYGAQLRVTHDTGILTFLVPPASSHNDVGGFFWDSVAENFVAVTGPSGIRLSGSMSAQTHPTPANLTNANIATWKYTCATSGTSALTYDTTTGGLGTKLADINGFEIPSALLGDSITCTANTASVDGYIGLQGRLSGAVDPTGWLNATVLLQCVSGTGCDGSGPYLMTTDASGHYQIVKSGAGTGVAYGTYAASVTRRGYLGATKGSNVVVNAPSITINPAATPQVPTLLGGDANDDGTVNVTDLSNIGLAFGAVPAGGADTGADINGDNIVNIFDLVLAGGNFGLSTSTWP